MNAWKDIHNVLDEQKMLNPAQVEADRVLFIKLGSKGMFEQDCLDRGVVRLDYREIDHDNCALSKWDEVQEQISALYETQLGATTSHRNQIKRFYEEPSTTMWITFFEGKLWHCFADASIKVNPDGTRERRTVANWSDCDANGRPLRIQELSGRLTKVQGFRGTICEVDERDYLLSKIRGSQSEELKSVEQHLAALESGLEHLIKRLNPKDFEVLVDLIFRAAGWSRVGELGKTTKTIDIELRAPVTNERAVVQVKSQSDLRTFKEYDKRLMSMDGYDKHFFVTHSPTNDLTRFIESGATTSIQVWDSKKLAELSINAGLIDWIIKVAP